MRKVCRLLRLRLIKSSSFFRNKLSISISVAARSRTMQKRGMWGVKEAGRVLKIYSIIWMRTRGRKRERKRIFACCSVASPRSFHFIPNRWKSIASLYNGEFKVTQLFQWRCLCYARYSEHGAKTEELKAVDCAEIISSRWKSVWSFGNIFYVEIRH